MSEIPKEKFDQIYKKIEEIYTSTNKEGKPTGKGFISHLIRAYFPQGKAVRVMDSPKKPMKCSITGVGLFGIDEVYKHMTSEEGIKAFKQSMLVALDPEKYEKTNHIEEFKKGREMAVIGQDTDRYLSHDAYQVFYNWMIDKLFREDKHIAWLLKDIRNKIVFKEMRKQVPEEKFQKTINTLEQVTKNPNKKASLSLGDLAALQELKAKFESDESGK